MSSEREAVERRERRLDELKANKAVSGASAALLEIWRTGRKPRFIVLRTDIFQPSWNGKPALTQLIRSRGLALRFYLLAVFEAQCRMAAGEKWASTRPLAGLASWSDLVAIDGAYSVQAETYMRDTKQRRTLADQRLRQVQSALRTLEEFGLEDEHVPGPGGPQALVSVPWRGKARKYGEFVLLNEFGRGRLQTVERYSVPYLERDLTMVIPSAFFLRGWIQVLSDAEIVVWLILLWLRQRYPRKHAQEGVYLRARRRDELGLLRDSWEDSCARLRDFGLIRYAIPPEPEAKPTISRQNTPAHGVLYAKLIEEFNEAMGSPVTQPARVDTYEPHRYQVLRIPQWEALEKVIKETRLRKQRLK